MPPALFIATFTLRYDFAQYHSGTMFWQSAPLVWLIVMLSTAVLAAWLIALGAYRRPPEPLTWLSVVAAARPGPRRQVEVILSGKDERAGRRTGRERPSTPEMGPAADDQQRLVDRQIITFKVLRAIGGSLEPDTVAYTAVETVAELTGWPTVTLATPDPATKNLVIRAAVGVSAIDQGVMGRAFRTGHTQLIPDDLISPTDYSALVIPLRHGRQRLGVFVVESDRPCAFSADDRLLAESLAEVIVLALDNARLYSEKQAQVEEMDRLFQTAAEERSRLQALIESDRDGIVMVSPAGVILVVNEPALRFFYLDGRPESWVGRPLLHAVNQLRRPAPAVARAVVAEMRRLRDSEAPGEGELELPPHTVHWRNLPVMAGDAPLGRLMALRDVTEERLLDRMRDDLIHTMVHDLRGPLSSISISLHLLEAYGQSLEPNGRIALDRARVSMDRVLNLVNAILEVSRLESGRITLKYEPVSLPTLVTAALELYLPLATERQVIVTADAPATLPLVWTDPTLIGRVLQNLVGNAVKFTPDGGRVRVTAEVNAADSTRLLVSVHDTGRGIPASIQGRLFQKFTTGDQAEKGSGLGLYFCKMVLEAHGERIWVGQTSMRGTTFCFTLPLSQS
jgi:signal transduction histidine kinase